MITDITQLAQDAARAYLATWNATDGQERRRLLDRHWSPEVRYVDPVADVSGRDGLNALIAGVQDQFPGFVFSLVGQVDAHHNQRRRSRSRRIPLKSRTPAREPDRTEGNS